MGSIELGLGGDWVERLLALSASGFLGFMWFLTSLACRRDKSPAPQLLSVMEMRLLALSIALLLAACEGGVMPPCTAFCVRFTTVRIHLVDDVTGDPLVVALGTSAFTANGQPTSPWCESDAGDTTDCSTVNFELYGPYTIQINIPGYMPAVLQTDVEANSKVCCGGPINPVDTTLRLKK